MEGLDQLGLLIDLGIHNLNIDIRYYNETSVVWRCYPSVFEGTAYFSSIYVHGKKITSIVYAQPPSPSSLVKQAPICLK